MDAPENSVAAALLIYRNAAKDARTFLEKGNTPDRKTFQEVFRAAESVLWAYCLPQNIDSDGRPIEYFPIDLAGSLAWHIGYIRTGHLPSTIKDMLRPGSPGVGPHERNDIALAVAYIVAARQGIIVDRHPSKSISELYGVTTRGVRKWQEKYKGTEPSDFYPNIDAPDFEELLNRDVKEAGLRYQQGGRGSQGRVDFPRANKRPKAEHSS